MRVSGNGFALSATDLVGYLHCHHLTALDRAVAEGALAKPKVWDPLLEILSERGAAHEQNYVEHLKAERVWTSIRIDGVEVTHEAVAETLAGMRSGVPVIVQGALSHQGWIGRADILRRVEVPSALGGWSYEAIDTKLARETKAGAVLQLCLYSDLLTASAGSCPGVYVCRRAVVGFRAAAVSVRRLCRLLPEGETRLAAACWSSRRQQTYPDPIEHCDICRWRETCDKRRRDDDHLCLVAGISKIQINELKARGIATVQGLAGMPLPLDWKPDRGSADSYSPRPRAGAD